MTRSATGGRAADVDNAAAAALNHVGDSFAGAADVAHNLAVKAVIPSPIGEIEDTPANRARSIVDQNIETAKLLNGGGNQPLDVIDALHIRLHRQYFDVRLAFDLLCRVFELLHASGAYSDTNALLGQSAGDSLTPAKRDHITFLTIGSEPARVQALLSGAVDVTIANPAISGAVKEAGFSYLGNFADMGIPVAGNALVSTKRYINEHSPAIEAFIKGTVEGIAYILDPANRDVVTQMLGKHLRLPPKVASRAYQQELIPILERKPYPNMEALKNTLQVMAAWNPKVSTLKAEDLVDTSILQKIDEDGFLDRLRP